MSRQRTKTNRKNYRANLKLTRYHIKQNRYVEGIMPRERWENEGGALHPSEMED